jgi:hypothetical protein
MTSRYRAALVKSRIIPSLVVYTGALQQMVVGGMVHKEIDTAAVCSQLSQFLDLESENVM